MQTFSADPPESDEIEVSLFGPGKGEAAAIHIGRGEWILIDSCVDARSGKLPVVEYLQHLGVDLANDVKLIISSHAHDDHFKGIADVWRLCKSAFFVCSAALSAPEFRALIDLEEAVNPGVAVSAYREFRSVLDIARERRPAMTGGITPIRRVLEGTTLLTRPSTDSGDGAAVRALSPSSLSLERSLQAFASVLPTTGSERHIANVEINELTVAVWIEVGEKRILLGGDLENGPSGCGWEAVVATAPSGDRASVYKVAHHGSDNAHHEGMWDRLVTTDCVAMVTPYRPGRKPRPSEEDVARISARTPNGYATAQTKRPTLSAAQRRAAAMLGPAALSVSEPWGRVGHVQARSRRAEPDWRIGLRASAYKFG